jgi:hypothetical protein
MGDFKPAFGLGNCHIQTVYSSLFRREKKLFFDKKIFSLSDGDFLECYWHHAEKKLDNSPIVVLFHGLAGSYKSPYIQGAIEALSKNGFDSVIMHFRGCTGNDNRLPRSYHSGDSGDALEFLKSIKNEFPKRALYAVGYSLGANMLLKLLGELKNNSLIEKAIAISPPMQLDACSARMNQGFSRYYQYRLIKDLNLALEKKYDKHDMEKLLGIKRDDIKNLKTFMDFDSAYTAPIHGFKSAQEYYTKSSSKQYLKDIKTDTLIIHSSDDPFMSQGVIPTEDELSESVTLKLTKKGGHVGFIGGTILKPRYWLEEEIVKYLLT